MKTYLNLVLACLFATMTLAQKKSVKIVFDVASGNTGVHKSAIKHM